MVDVVALRHPSECRSLRTQAIYRAPIFTPLNTEQATQYHSTVIPAIPSIYSLLHIYFTSPCIVAILVIDADMDVGVGGSGRKKSQEMSVPSGATIIGGKKTFTALENNPEVWNALAAKLGLSPALKFHNVYSLAASELLHIPRPVYALLVGLPLTPTWKASRMARDSAQEPYAKYGPDEPVIWFKQTIDNACGSIGLLHCLLNGPAQDYILPDTILSRLFDDAIPLEPEKRAKMLHDDGQFEVAHQSVASLPAGDSSPPKGEEGKRPRRNFVAFVRGEDGYLWELEGTRPGPIRKRLLREGEDLLSENVLRQSIGAVIRRNQDASEEDMRFSCVALARTDVDSLPMSFLNRGRSARDQGVERRSFYDTSYRHEHYSPPKGLASTRT